MSLTCTFHPRPVSHATATFESFESTEPKVSILGSTQVSTWRLCTKQHGVFLLLTHQRLKVPFVERCAVAWKTRLRKLCFNPKNFKTPKNASQFNREELRLSYSTFSLPLSHIATLLHSKVHFPPHRGCCMLA